MILETPCGWTIQGLIIVNIPLLIWVRTPTQEQYEDQNIIRIELMAPWDPPSPEFDGQEDGMFDEKGHFLSTNTPSMGQ